jgi:poly(3-hydroxybutyrate) depolymerase
MRALLLGLVFLLATGMSKNGISADYTIRDFEFENMNREVVEHIPSKRARRIARNAVFLIHGGGGSGAGFCEKADFLSHKPKWFIICPSAVDGSWNVREEVGSPNDVGFLSALVQDYVDNYNIRNVIFVGHSLGGMMTYTMVCRASDILDKAVVSAASLVTENCNPSSLVDGLVLHSLERSTPEGAIGDGRIPYICPVEGVDCRMNGQNDWPAALDGIEHLANLASCTGVVETEYDDDPNIDLDEATIVDYQNCSNDFQVVEHVGYHGYPGSPTPLYNLIQGMHIQF